MSDDASRFRSFYDPQVCNYCGHKRDMPVEWRIDPKHQHLKMARWTCDVCNWENVKYPHPKAVDPKRRSR